MNRNNCPYVENLVITAAPEFVESMDSNIKASFGHVSEATDLSFVDWAKEQLKDPYVARLISLVDSGIFPQKDELKTEHPDVVKYLRHWKNLSLENGILYRHTIINNERIKQLILPSHYRDLALTHLHDEGVIKVRIGLYH